MEGSLTWEELRISPPRITGTSACPGSALSSGAQRVMLVGLREDGRARSFARAWEFRAGSALRAQHAWKLVDCSKWFSGVDGRRKNTASRTLRRPSCWSWKLERRILSVRFVQLVDEGA